MYKLPSKKQIDSIKMIVCDLDGTLLNHHKKISPATIQSLLHLQEKGYTLVLASGRFFYELKEYIAQLKMQEYHGYAVCANGLEVHELATNKVHCFEQLKKSDAIKIIQMAKKRKIICYFNHQDCYYVNVSSFYKVVIDVVKCILYPLHKLMKHHYLLNGLYKLRFNASLEDSINDLHKICFLSTKHKLALFENEINAWQKPFVFYFVSRYTTEITHQSVGKYQALKYICEKRQLTMENVLAFGDSGNDLALLKHAGIGVAMKNAFSEIKAVTPYQTFFDNQHEGIHDYLHKLFI